jgi:hypothetical protein
MDKGFFPPHTSKVTNPMEDENDDEEECWDSEFEKDFDAAMDAVMRLLPSCRLCDIIGTFGKRRFLSK